MIVTEKIISDGTEYASVQDLLSIYQIRPLLFIWDSKHNEENVIITSGQKKKEFQSWMMNFVDFVGIDLAVMLLEIFQ